MNYKKEDSRGNDEETNTFVPAVFFPTSLRFLQMIVPINTRVNCSSLTRRSMFPADKLHGGNNLMSSRERRT